MTQKKSLKDKKWYADYKKENRAAKNKKAKLERHLKTHPNDVQAKKALAGGFGDYKGRTAPKRNRPLMITIRSDKRGEVTKETLTTLDNRISRDGKDHMQQLSEVRAYCNKMQYIRE